jgi:D-alanyl-D-alanine carboxypeptidase
MRRRKYRLIAASAVLLFLPLLSSCSDKRIVPEFALTQDDLRSICQSLPESIREGIMERPAEFLRLAAKVLDEPRDLFVIVDKQNELAADYVPSDLVPLAAYGLRVTRDDLLLRKAIMPAVLEMARAAAADGVTVTFSSTYRSYEYQRTVYEREVKTYGRETADRQSARPGFSQHQLGTAIDFGSISDGYENTPEGRWVTAHAWEYGFTLSYPPGLEEVTGYRYESWHYRFVTKPGALMQMDFFGGIQHYFLKFLRDHRGLLEAKRTPRD